MGLLAVRVSLVKGLLWVIVCHLSLLPLPTVRCCTSVIWGMSMGPFVSAGQRRYAVCCMLYAVYFVLYAACCMLCAVCCKLHAVCCMLYAACFVLYAICCMLCAVCCMLHAVCCMLRAVCCMPYAACCMLIPPHEWKQSAGCCIVTPSVRDVIQLLYSFNRNSSRS
jgi:hypothetical protein